MTREEAIERFNGIINAMSISIAQSKFYPSKAELDELCDMAIEALSKPINCIKCKHYYETEDDTGVHGHCRMDTAHTDLISRADAIDAVAEEWLSEASAESPYVNDYDIDKYRELAEDLFNDIPSAEYSKPLQTTLNDDLVSKADVIDAVCRTRCGDKAKGCPAHSCLVIEEFDALPSAELVLQTPQTYGKSINPSNAEVVEDLISRADAIALFYPDTQYWGDDIDNKLLSLPSADAVDVVRCKDCKHHEKFCFDDSKLLCWVHDIDIVVSPTDYCSYAERRAESEVKE